MADPELYNTFNNKKIEARQIDELIGFARGIIADGAVNQSEIEALQRWLATNVPIIGHPVLSAVQRQVDEVLSDGALSPDEAELMLGTLRDLCNDEFELGEEAKSSKLPLCKPAPQVVHSGARFCLTGTFEMGSRKDCEAAIKKRGGDCGSLTSSTDYLVIGEYVTESWKHSTFGNKILKAMAMRDEKGLPIHLVSEAHWKAFL